MTHKDFWNIFHSALKLESRLLEVEVTSITTYPIPQYPNRITKALGVRRFALQAPN